MSLESILTLLSRVPYDADLTSETLEFASGKPQNSMLGSLYFKSGRIRLVHPRGPKISKHERIRRYSLDKEGVRHLKEYRQRYQGRHSKHELIYKGLKKHGDLHRITINNGERLVEFFTDASGKTKFHLSRGGPITAPALKQVQIDLIARAANSRSNKVMKRVYLHVLSHLE
jgi:hypothetical protein